MFSREWSPAIIFFSLFFNKQHVEVNESERKRIYRDIYPREFKLLENTFTSCQTGTRKTIRNREHGSVSPRQRRKSRVARQSSIDEDNLFQRQSPFSQRWIGNIGLLTWTAGREISPFNRYTEGILFTVFHRGNKTYRPRAYAWARRASDIRGRGRRFHLCYGCHPAANDRGEGSRRITADRGSCDAFCRVPLAARL